MQNVKGTYDFLGTTQAIRKRVQDILQEVFELYDFDGMDTTILNERDLLTSKYAGGDEILKEMYQLTDQAGRSLSLRYDLTIPFAKVIALNPGLPMPYKRYEMGKVFRDGPVKRGRLREFLQCDVDVVGIEGPEAEAELMLIAAEVFKRLDLPIQLKWNNRRFLSEVLSALGVSDEDLLSVMLTLDKVAKIGIEGIKDELVQKGIAADIIAAILEFADTGGGSAETLAERYGIEGSQGTLEVASLEQWIIALGLKGTCRFDPLLSRGLSFYTGTVYEIFDANQSYGSSLGGGGRYDAIIGKLIGREDVSYPTVGLSFGMEAIVEMIKGRPISIPQALALVIPIGSETKKNALLAAAGLRAAGIRTSLATGTRKLKRSLTSASEKGIRYVILIGDDEVSANKVRLKDMLLSTESVLDLQEAVDTILFSN